MTAALVVLSSVARSPPAIATTPRERVNFDFAWRHHLGNLPPAALQPNYNDSSWALVDAPHDMLINQEFVRAAAALFLAFFFASLKRSRCAERRKHEGNGVPPAQLGLVPQALVK